MLHDLLASEQCSLAIGDTLSIEADDESVYKVRSEFNLLQLVRLLPGEHRVYLAADPLGSAVRLNRAEGIAIRALDGRTRAEAVDAFWTICNELSAEHRQSVLQSSDPDTKVAEARFRRLIRKIVPDLLRLGILERAT